MQVIAVVHYAIRPLILNDMNLLWSHCHQSYIGQLTLPVWQMLLAVLSSYAPMQNLKITKAMVHEFKSIIWLLHNLLESNYNSQFSARSRKKNFIIMSRRRKSPTSLRQVTQSLLTTWTVSKWRNLFLMSLNFPSKFCSFLEKLHLFILLQWSSFTLLLK